MLQLSASLMILKGIVRYTNAFLSSDQGADTTVASLNWEINGFEENFAVSIIVLYHCASPCNCIWEEHLLSIAPWRNWVTFLAVPQGPVQSLVLQAGLLRDCCLGQESSQYCWTLGSNSVQSRGYLL